MGKDESGGASSTGGAVAAAAAAAAAPAGNDAIYTHDIARLEAYRQQKPWMQDPKYFKRVKISPSAAMKMLMHSCSGVDKGMKAGGKPTEVMGLMLGRPDAEQKGTIIVTDAFPLPIEGAETRVLADDAEVANYMIDLGEALEVTRTERFMGWYHSHPFDVEVHSHCYLSSTDVSTQLSWQRAEDPHGNPWLAIVVDPLRSLAKGRPEFGAFRAYPPEYSAPQFEGPDGATVTEESRVVELFGTCWKSYYCLQIEYFMSSLAAKVLAILSENFLWMRTLSSTPMLEEGRERFAERVTNLSDKVCQCASHLSHGPGVPYSTGAASAAGSGGSGGGGAAAAGGGSEGNKEESALSKATWGSSELAIEHCQGQMTQLVKNMVFGVQEGAATPDPSQKS